MQKKVRNSSEGEQTSVKQEYDDDSCSSGHENLARSVSRWLPVSGKMPVQVNIDEVPSSSTRKRKHLDSDHVASDAILAEPFDQHDTTDSGVSARKTDVYDHFGRYISSLLREIGPPDSFLLQQEVTGLILARLREKSFVKREPNTPSLD